VSPIPPSAACFDVWSRLGHPYEGSTTIAGEECCLTGHGACYGELKAIVLSDGIWRICRAHGLIALAAAWRERTGN